MTMRSDEDKKRAEKEKQRERERKYAEKERERRKEKAKEKGREATGIKGHIFALPTAPRGSPASTRYTLALAPVRPPLYDKISSIFCF